MKRILLLGGSSQQVIAITKAKELGFYTILCDFLPDNPGRFVSDKYFCESTTDKESILAIAQHEHIDGIVAYSSDPAAPTAAYVAEKLGLKGVSYCIAKAFCNKNLFREFLKRNGFCVPQSVTLSKDSVASEIEGLSMPIIIKPTDSSGSKGVSVIHELQEFKDALEFACSISRNNIIIAEEFIERDHPDVIEAELFVSDGEIRVWGIMDNVRDDIANPLIPSSYCYPSQLSAERLSIIKNELSRLIKQTKVENGAFNIEMIFNKNNDLIILDAGPRNGGNMLPEYISMIASIDIPKATILSVMGDDNGINKIELDGRTGGFWGMYVIHTSDNGILRCVEYSHLAQSYLRREVLFKNKGSVVSGFNNSRDAIGLAFFNFPNREIQNEIMRDFTGKHIIVSLDHE